MGPGPKWARAQMGPGPKRALGRLLVPWLRGQAFKHGGSYLELPQSEQRVNSHTLFVVFRCFGIVWNNTE